MARDSSTTAASSAPFLWHADDCGAPTIDALEEESFALSSSASDAEFDAVVGCLEDVIMDDKFQVLQRNFMDKYYQEFEDTEENELIHTPIFNECISLVEKYIEEQLLERIPGFNMAAFTTTVQHQHPRPRERACVTIGSNKRQGVTSAHHDPALHLLQIAPLGHTPHPTPPHPCRQL
nr:ADP-ribosylation factor-like protein 2-binding protein [Peromyscus maniculatus bairdii]